MEDIWDKAISADNKPYPPEMREFFRQVEEGRVSPVVFKPFISIVQDLRATHEKMQFASSEKVKKQLFKQIKVIEGRWLRFTKRNQDQIIELARQERDRKIDEATTEAEKEKAEADAEYARRIAEISGKVEVLEKSVAANKKAKKVQLPNILSGDQHWANLRQRGNDE